MKDNKRSSKLNNVIHDLILEIKDYYPEDIEDKEYVTDKFHNWAEDSDIEFTDKEISYAVDQAILKVKKRNNR